jgi:hypothetical protein
LTTVNTNISWGFLNLIETFFQANNLKVECRAQGVSDRKIILEYEDDSDTAMAITFMSVKHLGFENMLCDYLKRCGIPYELIPIGNSYSNRDMKKLDEEWMEHRRKLGFR